MPKPESEFSLPGCYAMFTIRMLNCSLMRPEDLDIEESDGPLAGQRILRLKGPLLLSNLFKFQDAARAEKNATVLILDLTGVPYADSAGLGSILTTHVSMQRMNHRLVLVGVGERVGTLIRVTKVEQFLSMYPTMEAAEGALRQAATA